MVEVMVTLSILTVVLVAVFSLLFNVQRGYGRQVDRAASVEQARYASEEIQHEILSARAVTVPTAGQGLTMDAWTRTNELSRSSTLLGSCVQWQVYNGALWVRHWIPPYTSAQVALASWGIVTRGITNSAPAKPLFVIDPNSAYANRLVNITIRVNANPSSGGNDVVIAASVFGRNITYGTADPCASSQPTSQPT